MSTTSRKVGLSASTGVAGSTDITPVETAQGSAERHPEPHRQEVLTEVSPASEAAVTEPTMVEPSRLEPAPVEHESWVEWEPVPPEQRGSLAPDESPLRMVPTGGLREPGQPDSSPETFIEAIPSPSFESAPPPAPPSTQATAADEGEHPSPVAAEPVPLSPDRPAHDNGTPAEFDDERVDESAGSGAELTRSSDAALAPTVTMLPDPVTTPISDELTSAPESIAPLRMGEPEEPMRDQALRGGERRAPLNSRRILLFAALISVAVIVIALILVLSGRGSHSSAARTPPRQPSPVTGPPLPTTTWHFAALTGPVQQVIVIASNRNAVPVAVRIQVAGSPVQRVQIPARNAAEVAIPPRDARAPIVIRASRPIVPQRVVMNGSRARSGYGVPGP